MNTVEKLPLTSGPSINVRDDGFRRKRCDPLKHQTIESCAFSLFLVIFEIVVLFGFFFLVKQPANEFVTLTTSANRTVKLDINFTSYYHPYIEIAVMIFLGFGLLMTFLRYHGFYALGMTFLISCMAMQLCIFCIGYGDIIVELIHGNKPDYRIPLGLPLMVKTLFCAGAVLISMGVVIGKFTPLQLVIMCLIEVPFYALNVCVVEGLLYVNDTGGSLLVHAFGAYFGLMCSWITTKRIVTEGEGLDRESANGISDAMSIVGTIALWICWPSFNGALSLEKEHAIAINTILSLVACCIVAFIFSRMFRGKFAMCDLQNATIAGGVAIGGSSNFSMLPGVPTLIGILAGTLSITGFRWVQPFLRRYLRLHDSCGVHNLHGMPGLLGGFATMFISIYFRHDMKHKDYQPLYQFAGIAVTFVLACVAGAVTAGLIRLVKVVYPTQRDDYFNDQPYFEKDES